MHCIYLSDSVKHTDNISSKNNHCCSLLFRFVNIGALLIILNTKYASAFNSFLVYRYADTFACNSCFCC